jgi:lipopolysaccharide transport system permease protein
MNKLAEFRKHNVKLYDDLLTSATSPCFWLVLGQSEVRQRYARSKLGQLWVSINTAITLGILGVVWSVLWKQPIKEYLPYVAVSSVIWQFFSTTITESTATFTSMKGYILSESQVYMNFIFATIYRNLLFGLYNLPVALLFVILMGGLKLSSLMLLPVFAACLVLSVSALLPWSMLTSIICSRYRDVSQIIISLMQLIYFVSPVLWKEDRLPESFKFIIFLNPAASALKILRDPILYPGQLLNADYYHSLFSVFVFGCIGYILLTSNYSKLRQLPFWL